ncbi:11125_t:CDS:10 [Dentiscutata erythropus]|uniref:11125_t:CDS:1 n=1 Tax=Dentiscutata erythropus TaxID=1348616 RepID=A0A9N9IAA7_9GLOM|nr:11125_t:CDS:10 [Dentiscutata erythropus]
MADIGGGSQLPSYMESINEEGNKNHVFPFCFGTQIIFPDPKMEQDYKYLGWKDFGVDYLENNCDKVRKVRFASWFSYTINANSGRYGSMSDTFQIYKLACEKALRRSAKSSSILRDAYEGFSKVPDIWALMVVRGVNKQRTQYISTVEAMESMVSLKFVSPTEENPVFSNKKKIGKRLNDLFQDETSRSLLLYELRNLFESFDASNIEWNDPLSFGCIVDRNSDIIFGKLPEDLNKREMIVSLPPIPADFQGNDEEFEAICCYFNDENKAEYTEGTYIVRIVSNFLDPLFCYENTKLKIIWAEEVSEASQRRMVDSGEIRVGHKPDFRVKSPLIAGKVEICLMEASRVLPTNKKIRDDWDKLIKLMKDAHMRLLKTLKIRLNQTLDPTVNLSGTHFDC